MENLEGIKTVQDLLNAQQPEPTEEKDVAKKYLDDIYDEDPKIGLAIATHIVASLIGLHEEVIKGVSERQDINLEAAAAWHADMIQLGNAFTLLKSINL